MGRLLIAGEPGADIIPALYPVPGEWVIDKPGKGMFWGTCLPEGLHEKLQAAGITHLVFTGVTTEVCVQTSMREANDRGYDCVIVEDATESYFPAFKAAAIETLVAQGAIVGWATPSATLLAALPPVDAAG
jgi:nicotinamidase-related amidase